ncbi:TIGR03067 domain-containing protein [Singulisphaera sp. Ch08]|uniref:TIGR03067 domain-containing protein n=1 Tax=Singulisphaera sp. Ch08 TaxID=3120278 RepID=A0AAU7CGD9_9BACT
MKRFALMTLAVGFLLGADDDESARELTALQGSWSLVSLDVNGESLSDQPEAPSLLVSNALYVTVRDGRRTSYGFRLEPSTDPKAIELTLENGPDKGQILKGIYKLEGDLFTVCHGLTPQDDRPVEFSTGAESGHTLIVWRRAKAKPSS